MNSPEALLQAYESALESQQWSSVEPLLHHNISVTFTNGTFNGKESVQGVFESNFKVIQEERYKISNVHWILATESTTICNYIFEWAGYIQGEMCSGGGRGTTVMIQEGGQWFIVTEHLGPHASEA